MARWRSPSRGSSPRDRLGHARLVGGSRLTAARRAPRRPWRRLPCRPRQGRGDAHARSTGEPRWRSCCPPRRHRCTLAAPPVLPALMRSCAACSGCRRRAHAPGPAMPSAASSATVSYSAIRELLHGATVTNCSLPFWQTPSGARSQHHRHLLASTSLLGRMYPRAGRARRRPATGPYTPARRSASILPFPQLPGPMK